MANQLSTSITIQASPEAVWQVLTDFEAYPSWNPFIKSVKGEVAVGNQLDVQITNMKFKPKVLQFEENKAFVWLGNFILPGVFDGEHHFELVDNGDGTTTLQHFENFKGILFHLVKGKLLPQTKEGFEAMNKKLKERVEAIAK